MRKEIIVVIILIGILALASFFLLKSNGTASLQNDFECSDSIDNDGDGFIDYPYDPECESIEDNEIEIFLSGTETEKYFDPDAEFLGRIVRRGRTSFIQIPGDAVLDAPSVAGADNPSIFYYNGILYFIFGDPIKRGPDANQALDGAMAWTDKIVPEKGIHLQHLRNWVTEDTAIYPETDWDNNSFPDAKSIVQRDASGMRPNNIGGAVIELHGGEKRIWFAYYLYPGSPLDPNRVGFIYSDDMFESAAQQDPSLILWDINDQDNGLWEPSPAFGYSMKVFKNYVYVLLPRTIGPVLLRAHISNLAKNPADLTLSDWEHLVSVDENTGEAVWEQGLVRGQVSHDSTNHPSTYIPSMPFDTNPSIISSVIWNPYMNRWIAVNYIGRVWESKQFWGPYKEIMSINHPTSSYNVFTHETLLGDNGKYIYYARSRWPHSGFYGDYLYRTKINDKLKISLSQKSAIQDDIIQIIVTDNTGFNIPGEDLVVTVDGNPATFIQSDNNDHVFSYTMSGNENGGSVGVVSVNADATSIQRVTRDVALVVNQINNVNVDIVSHTNNQQVSGTVFLDVDVYYDAEPEDLGDGKPEVYIIKTELRHVSGNNDVVEDADVYAPYKLKLDTTRYENGLNTFKVIAYDTLNRRGEQTIVLNINNPPADVIQGNLVSDWNMELNNVNEWSPYNGAEISKISEGGQRSGVRSLLITENTDIDTYGGAEQVISGLVGGENLRFNAWGKLKSYVTSGENMDSSLKWELITQDSQILGTGTINPYGFFRRMSHEFTNPAGNTEVTVRFQVRDLNTNAPKIEGIIDDVVLREQSYPLVEMPTNLIVVTSGSENILHWDASTGVNTEYYYVNRSSGGQEFEKVAEVESYFTSYTDTELSGLPPESFTYRIIAVDFMGSESEPSLENSVTCVDDLDCNDGLFCNGLESCVGNICQAGTGNTCDDGVSCTLDNCDEILDSCYNIPNDNLCGPGLVCRSDVGCVVSICGDGVISGLEECDLDNLNNENCITLGYPAGGNLTCYPVGDMNECSFNASGCSVLPRSDNLDGDTTNFSNVSDITQVEDAILELSGFGKIDFTGQTLNFERLDLDRYVNISNRRIEINTTSGERMSNLNASAILSFYDISYTSPGILRDSVSCSDCIFLSYTNNIYVSQVPGFSYYEVVETYSPSGDDGGGGGGGGGGGDTPQCDDGIDNDGDNLIDMDDPGCINRNDNSEQDIEECGVNWQCDDWTECINGTQTRTCSDLNTCNITEGKPIEFRECELGVGVEESEDGGQIFGPGGIFSRWPTFVISAVAVLALIAAVVAGIVLWRKRRAEKMRELVK